MIVVDVETTGINPKKNSIVSIGAVDFKNPQNQFYGECHIWSGAEINDRALEINGFTKEQVMDKNKQTLVGLIIDFLNWAEPIKNKTLAGENIQFDKGFLQDAVLRAKKQWPFGYRLVDLHSLTYSHHLKKGIVELKNSTSAHNLNKSLIFVGLPVEPNPHHGLTGAKLEAEAFSRLIYGQKLLPEYSQYEIPKYLKQDLFSKVLRGFN